jgi:hypothetical protein
MRKEEVTMHRWLSTKHTLPKIKVIACPVMLNIRIEPQKTAHAHQEYKVEIGIMNILSVKPKETVRQVIIQRDVLLLTSKRII